jgi:hypothetical protein
MDPLIAVESMDVAPVRNVQSYSTKGTNLSKFEGALIDAKLSVGQAGVHSH